MMNWKGFGRKLSWPNFKGLAYIHLEGLRKTTKTSVRRAEILTQDLLNTKLEC
jgi:hypothetical protein